MSGVLWVYHDILGSFIPACGGEGHLKLFRVQSSPSQKIVKRVLLNKTASLRLYLKERGDCEQIAHRLVHSQGVRNLWDFCGMGVWTTRTLRPGHRNTENRDNTHIEQVFRN